MTEPFNLDVEEKTIPPFLAYFSRPVGSVIISANKCASRLLDDVLETKKGYTKLYIQDDTNNEFINHSRIKRKFFIYRDPLDRFFGWYNGFVYTPYKPVTEKYQSYTDLLEAAHDKLSFARRDLVENIHHFLVSYSESELIELLKWDTHTIPLHTYFEYTNFSPDDYHILDLYQVSNYIHDKTGDMYMNYPMKNIIMNRKNLQLLEHIHEIISSIYQKDYDILGCRVQNYNRKK